MIFGKSVYYLDAVEQVTRAKRFMELVQRMQAVVLAHYDQNKPTIMAVYASPVGLGAVILHQACRSLMVLGLYGEMNYSQIEKEGLAIIGLQKFHQYIYGRQFTLLIDHKHLLCYLDEHKRNSSFGHLSVTKMGYTVICISI
jgi:hypothetical protein